MLLRLGAGRVTTLCQLVHFDEHLTDVLAQVLVKFHNRAALNLVVKQSAFWNRTAEHFFEAHGLGAKLEAIFLPFLRLAFLVLDRIRLPEALLTVKDSTFFCRMEFYDIKVASNAERMGYDAKAATNQHIAPLFMDGFVMCTLVDDPAECCPLVFYPLTFEMDERPLPAAEGEMLDARE